LAPPLQFQAGYGGSSRHVYRTTLNLALSQDGASDQPSVFWNTWNQFTNGTGPANISTWEGRKLYYYRNDPNPNGIVVGFNGCALDETTLLLNEGYNSSIVGHSSGQCGSFARLLIGALAVNGSQSSFARIHTDDGTLFIVKDWQFAQTPSSSAYEVAASKMDYQKGKLAILALTLFALESLNEGRAIPTKRRIL